MRQLKLRGLLLIILSIFVEAEAFADGLFRTVVLSDQLANGTDASFKGFDSAVLNDAGVVAFTAELAGTNVVNLTRYGLWVSEGSGVTALVARGGEAAAGIAATDKRYTRFTRVVINETSQVAFSSGLSGSLGGVVSDFGVWSGATHENIEVVTAFNQVIPGTNPPLSPDDSFGALALNNRQELVFKSGLKSSPDSAIWLKRHSQGLRLIARSREPAPDDPSGLLSGHFNDVVRLNERGESVFEDQLRDSSAVVPNTRAIYLFGSDDNFHRVIGTGDSLSLNSTPITIEIPTTPTLNNLGHVSFRTSFSDSVNHKEGIFMYVDGAIRPVIVEDELTSYGQAERISYIGVHALDGKGGVSFKAAVREEPSTPFEVSTIFHKSLDGSIQSVARLGQQAPGLPAGTVFDSFNSFGSSGQLGTNSHGQTVFDAFVRDSESGQLSGFGVWAQDRYGALRAVIFSGQIIDVDDGPGLDARVIASYAWSGSGNNQDGLPSGFNDLGQLVLRVRFTDGSTGILVSNAAAVPEPLGLNLSILSVAFVSIVAWRGHLRSLRSYNWQRYA